MSKFKVSIFFLFILFLIAPHQFTVEAASSKDIIIKETANVRQKASLTAPVLSTAKKNERYLVLSETKNWVKIQFKKQSGWVSKKVVKNASLSKKGYTVDKVNYLYEKASNTSTVLVKLEQATPITIVSYQKGYYKAVSNGTTGYIKASAVSYQEQIVTYNAIGYVTSTSANVKKDATSSSATATKLVKDAPVQITGKKAGWYKVTAYRTAGWIEQKYITTEAPEMPTETIGTIRVNSLHSNVREEPSLSSEILYDTQIKGEQFDYYRVYGDWYAIKLLEETVGYIHSSLISIYTPSEDDDEDIENPGDSEDDVTIPDVGDGTLEGKTIVLDAGHGGKDSGSTSVLNLMEKNMNLLAATNLQKTLEAAGAKVIMTRSNDIYLTLQERVNISHKYNTDLFISIHHDSAVATATGFTTYYYYKRDLNLANMVNAEMVNNLPLRNRGTKYGNFHVIRENKKPSLLLELGFMSNKSDVLTFNTESYRSSFSKSIKDALVSYYQ